MRGRLRLNPDDAYQRATLPDVRKIIPGKRSSTCRRAAGSGYDTNTGLMTSQSAQEADGLLHQWFREQDKHRARTILDALMRQHAEPLIRRIVGFKLESPRDSSDRGTQRADVEDVCSTAIYNLLARLQRVKSGEGDSTVRNFSGYAAVTAYNACNEYFRARKPAWVRLSMKIRYLATHASTLGLWQTAEGQEVCGLARNRGRAADRDIVHLAEACKSLWQHQDPQRLSLSELIETILKAARGPLVLEDLVDLAAEWSGVKETWAQSLDEDRSERTNRWELADGQPPAELRLRVRQYIGRLWKEICELPLEHRKALLLNLEDSAGGDIQLFEALGIAGIRQIAETLEMEPLLFAELWNKLPLDDAAIAQQLGLSRQDVANRRSSARKRLARKMREFEQGN